MIRRSLPLNRHLVIAIATLIVGALAPAIGSAAPPAATMLTAPIFERFCLEDQYRFCQEHCRLQRGAHQRQQHHLAQPDGHGQLHAGPQVGSLNVAIGSSTGGYIIFDHCNLEPLQPKP